MAVGVTGGSTGGCVGVSAGGTKIKKSEVNIASLPINACIIEIMLALEGHVAKNDTGRGVGGGSGPVGVAGGGHEDIDTGCTAISLPTNVHLKTTGDSGSSLDGLLVV